MANDLVRWGYRREEPPVAGEEEWDEPPLPGPAPRLRHGADASGADRDASNARRRGDGTFAVVREADAADNRQSVWDWGDARTWLIIAAMCLGFLAFCLFVYVMPEARHNQMDLPNPTPPIRVY